MVMHEIRFAQPGIQTARYVHRYVQRTTQLGGASIAQPVPARLEYVIAFQFGEPCYIQRASEVGKAPNCVIAGSQTCGGKSLMLRGNMDAFYIFLRPTAFQALFGIPMVELSDKSYSADDLLGNSMIELQEQLGEVSSLSQRVQVAERFIINRSLNPAIDRTERIVERILASNGDISIQDLASDFALSTRQLSRAFSASVGMSPKVFARIARFQAVMAFKTRSPEATWARAAQEFRFHDQMHLVREFRKLSGETPNTLLNRLAFLS